MFDDTPPLIVLSIYDPALLLRPEWLREIGDLIFETRQLMPRHQLIVSEDQLMYAFRVGAVTAAADGKVIIEALRDLLAHELTTEFGFVAYSVVFLPDEDALHLVGSTVPHTNMLAFHQPLRADYRLYRDRLKAALSQSSGGDS